MLKQGIHQIVWLLSLSLAAASCAQQKPAHAHPHAMGDHQHAYPHTPARIEVSVDTELKPWTHLDFLNDPNNFQFAVIADKHGGYREGVFGPALEKLNRMQPEFVVSVGDLIGGYTDDRERIAAQWQEFNEEIAQLEMPFFYTVGNHDTSNAVMKEEWLKRYGRTYYHFIYRDVLFLIVSTEDPPLAQEGSLIPRISEEQVTYFRNVLDENPDVRWTIALMHQPPWTYEESCEGWQRIEQLLQDRAYTVFAGHTHDYMQYRRFDRNYYVLATTGGGSDLHGVPFGQFDHIVWVTMTEQGPIIANLLLEGILGDQLVNPSAHVLNGRILGGLNATGGPLLGESPGQKIFSSYIKVENESDVPVEAGWTFRPHDTLFPQPATGLIQIPPKSNILSEVAVAVAEPAELDQIEPLVADVTFSWQLPDVEETYSIDGKLRMRPVLPTAVEAVDSPKTIDGRLDDWTRLEYEVLDPFEIQMDHESWAGPQDGRFKFDLKRDNQFVYIAVEAFDDEFVQIEDEFPWQQDSVEIRLDARPDPERSVSRGQGEFESILLIAITPGEDETEVFGADQLPQGLKARCRVADRGYVTEVAVPVEYLNRMQGRAWEAFRLNITMNDYDEAQGAQLWWQPDWRREQNIAGSGTFIRETMN